MNEIESRAWHWEHIGWSVDILPFFTEIAHRIPQGGTYVEVGVFLGRSLSYMGTIRPDLHLVAIDPWADGASQGYDGVGEHVGAITAMGGLYAAFLMQMRRHAPEVLPRTKLIREFSHVGLAKLEPASVDMVFIDGAHDEASVRADILAAERVLKPGGILSGHDYCGDNGVMTALDKTEVTLAYWTDTQYPGWLPGKSTCWWMQK